MNAAVSLKGMDHCICHFIYETQIAPGVQLFCFRSIYIYDDGTQTKMFLHESISSPNEVFGDIMILSSNEVFGGIMIISPNEVFGDIIIISPNEVFGDIKIPPEVCCY